MSAWQGIQGIAAALKDEGGPDTRTRLSNHLRKMQGRRHQNIQWDSDPVTLFTRDHRPYMQQNFREVVMKNENKAKRKSRKHCQSKPTTGQPCR